MSGTQYREAGRYKGIDPRGSLYGDDSLQLTSQRLLVSEGPHRIDLGGSLTPDHPPVTTGWHKTWQVKATGRTTSTVYREGL